MLLERLPIIGQLRDAEIRQRHLPRRTEELEPHLARIGAFGLREFVDERANRERLEDVVDGSEPSDPCVCRRLADFSGDVRDRKREIEHALLQVVYPWLRRAAEHT